MAVSQFTIYSSSDIQGPGLLFGTTGSLISVLDACLVNGYGTGSYNKPAAGWTKPFPNVTASAGTGINTASLACYKQPSGSQFTLFINDYCAGTGLGREAWACGYELLSSLTGSGGLGVYYTASNGNGTGYGQFPNSSQLLTYGHVTWRKSSTTDTTNGRTWIIAADAYTMYMWVLTGDTTGYYVHFGFGDFYALRGPSDNWRCFIYGKTTEAVAAPSPGVNDYSDVMVDGASTGATLANTLGTAMGGHYVARNMGGTGGSAGFSRKGDGTIAIGSFYATAPYSSPIAGTLACPNPADNSLYVSPLWVFDPLNYSLRGRFRGLYQPGHASSNFSDGQTIQGSGDYSGKSFYVVRPGYSGASVWFLETSNTLDTN